MTSRLILDPAPQSGAWNMAFDEVLLESAIQDGSCSVRIYRWSEPTVSLGYFQQPGEIAPESPLAELAKVRRLTGGGAILHHHEWTYSCAVPAGHAAIQPPTALYVTVHRALIALLARCNVESQLRGDVTPTGNHPPSVDPPPFLCFAAGDSRDIIVRGRKIVGSAQRRRKGAVLQHGSILLNSSSYAPHLPGLNDVQPGFFEPSNWGRELGEAIVSKVAPEYKHTTAGTAQEQEAAARLQRERYERLNWRRSALGTGVDVRAKSR